MSYFDVLDRVKPKLTTTPVPAPKSDADKRGYQGPARQAARTLVVDNESTERTYITVPLTTAGLDPESFLTRLRGRLVGAEAANSNGQYWTTSDLAFGLPSVASGPLNWLHQDKQIIGALTDAELIGPPEVIEAAERELAAAAFVSADDRRKMAQAGVAMPDGSFPIPDRSHLESAIRLARTDAQRRHVIKRARALGLSNLIPDAWTSAGSRQAADADGPPYIEAASVVWSYLYPAQSRVIAAAAESGQLYYSMECISHQVQCYGPAGCGALMSYPDAIHRTDAACVHIRDKAAQRRFVGPIFQGAAVIVPPVQPGWSGATVGVLRAATAAQDVSTFADGNTELTAQILAYITTGA